MLSRKSQISLASFEETFVNHTQKFLYVVSLNLLKLQMEQMLISLLIDVKLMSMETSERAGKLLKSAPLFFIQFLVLLKLIYKMS